MGGQASAARQLGVSAGLVWQWLNYKRPVGPSHCPHIERLSGARCEELRPDVEWTRDKRGTVVGYVKRLS